MADEALSPDHGGLGPQSAAEMREVATEGLVSQARFHVAERLQLSANLAPVARANLREEVESETEVFSEVFKSGETRKNSEIVKKMREKDPATIVASVDSDAYAMKWHKPDWYEKFMNAALVMTKCYQKFDAETLKWYEKLKPAVELFAKYGQLEKTDFKRQFRGFKNDVFKLVKSSGGSFIYGSEGFLNFATGFDRILTVYPALDGTADSLSVETLKIVKGSGKGKKDGVKDRFVYMTTRKKAASEPDVPVVEPAVAEAPVVQPETAETEPRPAFNTPEFFEFYEIKESEITEFKDFVAFLEPWLSAMPPTALEDPAFWANVNDTASRRLFESKRANGIDTLVAAMRQFSGKFVDFYEDPESKDNGRYKNLNFWAVKRQLEFLDKYGRVGMITPDLDDLYYHRSIIAAADNAYELSSNKSDVIDQTVKSLEFLIGSGRYSSDSPVVAEMNEKLAKYKTLKQEVAGR